MDSLNVSGKDLVLPALIPSISSFETQLDLLTAISLQVTLQEPVSLVSAFDLLDDPDGKLKAKCHAFRRNGIMFLDSGGYETSRMRRYRAKLTWDLGSFLAVAAQTDTYDFAFSFDEFPDIPNQNWVEYSDALAALLAAHDTIDPERLIPVIHFRNRDDAQRFPDDECVALVGRIARASRAPMVAVTERELGYGLAERVELARKLKAEVAKAGRRLHLLGCGNPLSFAAFVEAGVDSCDGLEWCRTHCSSDLRLYHFQHSESLGNPLGPLSIPAELLLEQSDDFAFRTAVVNLNNFAHLIEKIQANPSDAINTIKYYYNHPPEFAI